jgi:signal transduction histidine kinase
VTSSWTRTRRSAALVGLAGTVVAVVIGLARGASAKDAVELVLIAATAALLAALLGWWVIGKLRRTTVRSQAVVVAVVVVVATGVGVIAAAQAMFISAHDLTALLVVLVAAGSAGVAAALRLGGRVDADSRAVEDLASRMGLGSDLAIDGGPLGSAELERLANRITSVSAELDAARTREQAMEQSRRELIAWISHDLRGPLASIRAMAEALEDGVVDDPAVVARYHAATRAETQRLSRMVDDLFELSRITAGATSLCPERVPLDGVVADAIETVTARAELAGVTIERRYGDLPSVRASVPELNRVLHNLLDNAIRHSPPGGVIVVRAFVDDDGTGHVTVEDECGGIPEPDLDRVFDLAFRGDGARGRDGGGGLGLTIAKGLVEAHHGSLVVDNVASGCRFTVSLPDESRPATSSVPAAS